MKLSIKKINRNTIINWLVFGVSMIVCFFLAELVMRQVYPSFDPRGNVVFHTKEDGVVLAEPNFSGRQWRNSGEFNVKVDINAYGFRDKKDLKNANSDDIFLVGDSFSFGHGVEEEERFGNVLQKLFTKGEQVYNLAISSSHFLNYKKNLEYAEKQGVEIENLMVGVCMENDILDYNAILKAWETKVEEDDFSLKDWLNRKSCLYNFIAANLQSNRNWRSFLIKIGLVNDGITHYEIKESTSVELSSSLEALKKIIENRNSLVILIPSRMNWVSERSEITNASHEKFKTLLIENQIQFLDMKPVIESNGGGRPLETLHFKLDGHWNAWGHELAADSIFACWQKLRTSEVLDTSEVLNENNLD